MEDNFFDAIAIFGSVLLFLFASSIAVYSYGRLNDQIDQFMNVSSASGRREDATSIYLDEEDIERKVPFEEVCLAILNLPRYISNDGNFQGSEIWIINGGATHKYSAEYDMSGDKRYILLDSVGGYGNIKYDMSDKGAVLDVLKDIIPALDGNAVHTGNNSNDILKSNNSILENLSFSISYYENVIKYTKNS